jgi:hypothetical protein
VPVQMLAERGRQFLSRQPRQPCYRLADLPDFLRTEGATALDPLPGFAAPHPGTFLPASRAYWASSILPESICAVYGLFAKGFSRSDRRPLPGLTFGRRASGLSPGEVGRGARLQVSGCNRSWATAVAGANRPGVYASQLLRHPIRGEGGPREGGTTMHFDAVFWGTILSIAILVFLGFKVVRLMNRDAREHRTQQ